MQFKYLVTFVFNRANKFICFSKSCTKNETKNDSETVNDFYLYVIYILKLVINSPKKML